MNERKQGETQVIAAAKANTSEHSARRIDCSELTTEPSQLRHWYTRKDPLEHVWGVVLAPMPKADHRR